ncbi:MAG: hypothetical protein AAB478_04420 [Patescibacteria group bacterium]
MENDEGVMIRIVYDPYTVNNIVIAVCIASLPNSRKVGQINWQQIITDRDVLEAAQPYVAYEQKSWRNGWGVVNLDTTLNNRFGRLVKAIVKASYGRNPQELSDAAD